MPLCRECYDEHYTSCSECGRIIHLEDARYEDCGDEPLCYRCYEDKEINNDLEGIQEIVGGLIQAIYPFDHPEITFVCNEEGKLNHLPLNRALFDKDGNIVDIVAGTFFLCSAPADSENFESLTDEQIEKYKKRFKALEIYIKNF